jgi:hypothetical protein
MPHSSHGMHLMYVVASHSIFSHLQTRQSRKQCNPTDMYSPAEIYRGGGQAGGVRILVSPEDRDKRSEEGCIVPMDR